MADPTNVVAGMSDTLRKQKKRKQKKVKESTVEGTVGTVAVERQQKMFLLHSDIEFWTLQETKEGTRLAISCRGGDEPLVCYLRQTQVCADAWWSLHFTIYRWFVCSFAPPFAVRYPPLSPFHQPHLCRK